MTTADSEPSPARAVSWAAAGHLLVASVVTWPLLLRARTDLLGSLFTAVLIIFAMLTLLFGSLRLGILSIPPNILPLVGTMVLRYLLPEAATSHGVLPS